MLSSIFDTTGHVKTDKLISFSLIGLQNNASSGVGRRGRHDWGEYLPARFCIYSYLCIDFVGNIL